MTVDTTEPVYHAGDLIGYNRAWMPIYLPGGGAPKEGEIEVDDGDDDDDQVGHFAPGDLDEDDDDDEPGTQQPPPKQQTKPSYKQLQEEVTRLREGNTRNNRELATRRHLEGFMKTHQIDDLDSWLAGLGVDKTTAQLVAGPEDPGEGSGSSTEPPEAPPAGDGNTNGQEQPPQPPAAPPVVSEQAIEQRIRLEVAKRLAQEKPTPKDDTPPEPTREEILANRLKDKEIDNVLTRLNFSGDRAKLNRVLDLTGVELDDNNEVVGADAAVQDVRAEFPEWFRRPRVGAAARNGGEQVDGGDKTPPPPKKQRWEDQVVDRWRSGQ